MRKLLSLTTKDFLSGISQDDNMINGGLFYSSQAVNPYISRSLGSIGITAGPTAVGSAIDGTGLDITADSTNVYFTSTTKLYAVSTAFVIPSLAEKRSVSNLTDGLQVFQTIAGSKYLYYWQNGQIGRWDLATTYADNWDTTITSSTRHPTLRIDDRIFFGSGNFVEYMLDSGGADPTVVTQALDLPKEYTITSLETDGYYLIIGASKNTGAPVSANDTLIYFWDWQNNLVSWTKTYSIRDEKISSLKNIDGVIYACGNRGLYAFNFGSYPKLIRSDIKTYGYQSCVSRFNDALVFIQSDNTIGTYGKMLPGVPTAKFVPFVTSVQPTLVKSDLSSSIIFYVSDKFYYQNPFAGSTDNSYLTFPPTPRTAYIPLGDSFKIERLDFIFGSTLTSGDSISIINLSRQGGDLLPASTFSDITYTVNGAVGSAQSTGTPITCDELAIDFIMSGKVKIKRIDIYGEEINR